MDLNIITSMEALQQVVRSAIRQEATALTPDSLIKLEKPEIIDTKELCRRLDVTEPTVIRWRRRGKLPYLQLGASIRFNYPAVIAALEITNRKGGKQNG